MKYAKLLLGDEATDRPAPAASKTTGKASRIIAVSVLVVVMVLTGVAVRMSQGGLVFEQKGHYLLWEEINALQVPDAQVYWKANVNLRTEEPSVEYCWRLNKEVDREDVLDRVVNQAEEKFGWHNDPDSSSPGHRAVTKTSPIKDWEAVVLLTAGETIETECPKDSDKDILEMRITFRPLQK